MPDLAESANIPEYRLRAYLGAAGSGRSSQTKNDRIGFGFEIAACHGDRRVRLHWGPPCRASCKKQIRSDFNRSQKSDCIPFSDIDYAPIDPYGEAKVKSEELIHALLPRDKFLILRPTYIWGPGHEGFRNGLLYRLLKGQLIISNNPKIKRYYGYVETIAAQTLALSRLSFVDLPRKVYYISDDAIYLGELCGYLVLALGRGKAWSAPSSLIKLLGTIGTLNSKLGLPAPINSIQARDLTTNFPVPIEPTLSLTGCVTDLTLAAAKTVSWAIRTDERFRSAIDSHTTPRLGGRDRSSPRGSA